MPRKILAIADQVQECPIFKVGDRMSLMLLEVVTSESDGVCAIALSDLLPWAIKVTAGGNASDQALLCRGCRGGRAQAGFILEAQGEVVKDARTTQRLNSLKSIALFQPLPDRQLEKIFEKIHEVEFPAGTPIINAGEHGKALHVVARGQVEVVKPAEGKDGQELVLGILNIGEVFGEMSLLTGDPASATIRAKDNVKTLSIVKADFDDLLQKNPVLNSYFSKLLALRLKQTNTAASKAFVEELEKGVTGQLSMLAGAELIQAITVTSRTGVLGIKDGKKVLELYFNEGNILNVSTTLELELDEAFYDFLTWKQGSFRFSPGERPDLPRNFQKDTTGLLLEGMRRQDEKTSPAPS